MQKFPFFMKLHRIEVGRVPISETETAFALILHCVCIDFAFMTVTFHSVSEIGTPLTSHLCNFMKNGNFCMIVFLKVHLQLLRKRSNFTISAGFSVC